MTRSIEQAPALKALERAKERVIAAADELLTASKELNDAAAMAAIFLSSNPPSETDDVVAVMEMIAALSKTFSHSSSRFLRRVMPDRERGQ